MTRLSADVLLDIPCVKAVVPLAKVPETRIAMTVMLAGGIALLVIGALAHQSVLTGISSAYTNLCLGLGATFAAPFALMLMMGTLCCPAITVKACCPGER